MGMMLMTSFLCAASAITQPLRCGVGTTMFQQDVATLETAVGTNKLSFWWNWGTGLNIDSVGMPAQVVSAARSAFIPMLWGQAPVDSYSFLDSYSPYVMGYNEPDLYGPACCNCDGKQTYAPATSSGWLPLFNPTSAANFWKDTVNNMTTTQRPGTLKSHIISPSMANGAMPAAGIDCTLDPASPANAKRCEGWLQLFKKATLGLSCARFDGTRTNCWDAIDGIAIHAYAMTPQEVLAKIDKYLAVFADDFAGVNGRSRKTLWLTEVAAASSDQKTILQFVEGLMSSSGGLADRTKYGAVSHVSWFSEYFFPAFNVTGHVAREHESWTSPLFNPFGGLNSVGDAFFANCAPSN